MTKEKTEEEKKGTEKIEETGKNTPNNEGIENESKEKSRGFRKKSFKRRDRRDENRTEERLKKWVPRTELGKKVLKGEFKTIDDVIKSGQIILESEIVDYLVPDLKDEVIYVGGSPGKGGGIRRTATKRTVRMHKSGRRFKLTSVIVIGNQNGVIGIAKASAKEHRNALEKALEKSKTNVIRVKTGCGSWECGCGGGHSIPFKTSARVGSVEVVLYPAPKGVGIVASAAAKKILNLAGIKDIWVKTRGQTRTRGNLATATFEALKNLNRAKGDL
jgi:small subunit ribosomal protein S5